MQELGALLGLLVLCAIIGTAIYSRKTYDELVKLNQKIDKLIDHER